MGIRNLCLWLVLAAVAPSRSASTDDAASSNTFDLTPSTRSNSLQGERTSRADKSQETQVRSFRELQQGLLNRSIDAQRGLSDDELSLLRSRQAGSLTVQLVRMERTTSRAAAPQTVNVDAHSALLRRALLWHNAVRRLLARDPASAVYLAADDVAILDPEEVHEARKRFLETTRLQGPELRSPFRWDRIAESGTADEKRWWLRARAWTNPANTLAKVPSDIKNNLRPEDVQLRKILDRARLHNLRETRHNIYRIGHRDWIRAIDNEDVQSSSSALYSTKEAKRELSRMSGLSRNPLETLYMRSPQSWERRSPANRSAGLPRSIDDQLANLRTKLSNNPSLAYALTATESRLLSSTELGSAMKATIRVLLRNSPRRYFGQSNTSSRSQSVSNRFDRVLADVQKRREVAREILRDGPLHLIELSGEDLLVLDEREVIVARDAFKAAATRPPSEPPENISATSGAGEGDSSLAPRSRWVRTWVCLAALQRINSDPIASVLAENPDDAEFKTEFFRARWRYLNSQ